MDIQEFPKMLYKGGANTIVQDAEQEKAACADGWHYFGQEPGEKPEKQAAGKAPAGTKKA